VRRLGAAFVAVAAIVAGFLPGLATPADAAPAAVAQPGPSAVRTDALPTVQVDGVVWSQIVVGRTVFAAGKFSYARPAGAAPGTQLLRRTNLLSYDLPTGRLTPFAPMLNGQVLALAASPDGRRLYVGGDFTRVNGHTRYRFAMLATSNGALLSTVAPALNSQVRSIVATLSTIYVGGAFTTANGRPHARLAAFAAYNGAVTRWTASANASVYTMVVTPDRKRLLVGGAFSHMNGRTHLGLAAVSPATGASMPFLAETTVRDYGKASAITSLKTDGTAVYGTGYNYLGGAGNLEGTFSANPKTGAINWIEDCHGDTYSSFPVNGLVYIVGHPHNCATLGGFDDVTSRIAHHGAFAFTAAATGTLLHNMVPRYPDFGGKPSPSLVNWFPELTPGTVTSAHQAAWSVTGNAQYLALGGEFTAVNGVPQQGLARLAIKPISPAHEGPRVSGAALVPTLVSLSPTSVQASWLTNWDRDDQTLAYQVIRDGDFANPVFTGTGTANFWNRQTMTFTDNDVLAESTHRYRLYVSDPDGNTAAGDSVMITLPAAITPPPVEPPPAG
jgi:hypothetical protein